MLTFEPWLFLSLPPLLGSNVFVSSSSAVIENHYDRLATQWPFGDLTIVIHSKRTPVDCREKWIVKTCRPPYPTV